MQLKISIERGWSIECTIKRRPETQLDAMLWEKMIGVFIVFLCSMIRSVLFLSLLIMSASAFAQEFSRADSLRGTLNQNRSCFDVHYYHLDFEVDIEQQTITGVNHIYFNEVEPFDVMQIDLFENMVIDSIVHQGSLLEYEREFNAVHVKIGEHKEQDHISVYYHGKPTQAKRAPWDGGFVWRYDKAGNPWVGVACEGDGASLWWPNKDHLSDEPDSMRISCVVPDSLMFVSNGDLESVVHENGKKRFTWRVGYPINNYNVTVNIADYIRFYEFYITDDYDTIALDYYVLRYNEEKAREQFKQVKPMMECFEDAFGVYPFADDGFALVETHYLGMEHQGAIAYGNKYMPGYLGRYPGEMDFDYIIIHETGHEWWGNSVSAKDIADMWIHESFCTYSESVFVECTYGYENMLLYLAYQRGFITNTSPMQGPYGVNKSGNGTDMYYKGAWMIHTLRNVLNNDTLFKGMLKDLALEFRHQTIEAKDVIDFISERTGQDFTVFFRQYLNHGPIPKLEYKIKKGQLSYRWNAITDFQMPAEIVIGDQKRLRINPSANWQTMKFDKKALKQLGFRVDLFLFDPVLIK